MDLINDAYLEFDSYLEPIPHMGWTVFVKFLCNFEYPILTKEIANTLLYPGMFFITLSPSICILINFISIPTALTPSDLQTVLNDSINKLSPLTIHFIATLRGFMSHIFKNHTNMVTDRESGKILHEFGFMSDIFNKDNVTVENKQLFGKKLYKWLQSFDPKSKNILKNSFEEIILSSEEEKTKYANYEILSTQFNNRAIYENYKLIVSTV